MPIDTRLARRTFLRRVSAAGALIRIGLPPLEAMFNTSGTAYAAGVSKAIPKRFVFWFNGNGILEKYWVPRETGADYAMLLPAAARAVSGRYPHRQRLGQRRGPATGARKQPPSFDEAVVSCRTYTGRGAGGPSIDQVIAQKIGGDTRFRSLQIGVCQESFGESIQRNLSWAGP